MTPTEFLTAEIAKIESVIREVGADPLNRAVDSIYMPATASASGGRHCAPQAHYDF